MAVGKKGKAPSRKSGFSFLTGGISIITLSHKRIIGIEKSLNG